jgi:hypothetical protein
LFLDIDVIFMGRTGGEHETILAIAQLEKEPAMSAGKLEPVWGEIFDNNAKMYLHAIYDMWDPHIVLMTGWCRFFKKEKLTKILNRGGLEFVADNLHECWSTRTSFFLDNRGVEVAGWLRDNPGFENHWLVLDGNVVGDNFADWQLESERLFIILCRENIGLADVEYQKLKTAFQLRANNFLNYRCQ